MFEDSDLAEIASKQAVQAPAPSSCTLGRTVLQRVLVQRVLRRLVTNPSKTDFLEVG